MCGIVGFISRDKKSKDIKELISMQVELLRHRGPNNKDFYIHKNLALGHTRLSILDLSAKGNQPMHSQCRRYVITFNGEIYNFKDLRRKVKNIHFKTESDTEVIVEYISAFGIQKTLESLDGMFAIGIWDKKKKELTIGRDRFGIKPLYWSIIEGSFFFSSELKTFKLIPGCSPRINKASLLDLLQYSCVASPKTIFDNIFKLEPGKFITFGENQELKNEEYWNSSSLIIDRNIYSNDFDTCKDFIENELEKSIKSTMVSDVPIGAFLSGGVDSSLVTSMMVKLSKRKVQTFSIGFEEQDFNEANFAKKISNHLKTDHSEAYVSEKDLINVIPLLPEIYCEPFGDSSQIPTYLVSKLSSKKTKVILSGDGADEIFGGYNRYLIASKYWKLLSNIPHSLRTIFKKILSYLGPNQLKALAYILKESNHKDLMLKLEKFLKIIDAKSIESYHLELCSQLSAPSQFLVSGTNNAVDFFSLHDKLEFSDPIMRMMAVDSMHYLPTDILTKVDRAAMNYSLETRIPYLDLDLFKFVISLPMKYKVSKNTKYILRDLAYKKIPKNILDKPKMGFGVPIKDWLRDELSDWANDVLSSTSLSKTGIFQQNSIDNLWNQHVQLKSDNSHQLWNILMLQSWLLEHANEY